MRKQAELQHVAVYGIDIGKSVFHVAGLDATGRPVFRKKLKRDKILAFFSNIPVSVTAMEACPGSQWLARKLKGYGHDARILPAQFVKPYAKSNKNDNVDAEAIAEAATRPTMRFVQIKRVDQIDVQATHRARDMMVYQRTALISQMRAILLEQGFPMRGGAGAFKLDLDRVLGDGEADLTPSLLKLIATLRMHLRELEAHIAEFTQEIEGLADRDDVARRLQTIPGIGPLAATALIAAVGDGRQFRRARDLSAWLGLVPAQYSTGGKPHLLGISKRGNSYVRRLLIHGARSCVVHMDRSRNRLGVWLDQLSQRVHVNKLTAALANKIARMAWAIITRPAELFQKNDPRFAV
ncbi:MAG TPA: IS110 family transposase [Steroidobacteraceae bacterium]